MRNPMTPALLICLFPLAASAAPEQAPVEQRVQQLEQQVRELTERLDQLERSPAREERPAYAVPLEEANAPEKAAEPGWKSAQAWEKIRRGMNQIQVTQILGNPSKRSGDSHAERWHYEGNKAWVEFDRVGEVRIWQAPK